VFETYFFTSPFTVLFRQPRMLIGFETKNGKQKTGENLGCLA
jgi:hypothetical protein